jgi:hypothetical protein
VDAQVLTVDASGDVIGFRHALLGEAAYARLLPAQRRELHGAVASALVADPALVERAMFDASLAHHLDRAAQSAPALVATLRAARRATTTNPSRRSGTTNGRSSCGTESTTRRRRQARTTSRC